MANPPVRILLLLLLLAVPAPARRSHKKKPDPDVPPPPPGYKTPIPDPCPQFVSATSGFANDMGLMAELVRGRVDQQQAFDRLYDVSLIALLSTILIPSTNRT